MAVTGLAGKAVVVLGVTALAALGAATAATSAGAVEAARTDRTPSSRGLSYAGLDRSPECGLAFHVVGRPAGVCSHGPDAAVAGVDVAQPRSTAELAATAPSGTSAPATGGVPCYGDGVSGPRVQAVYLRASDVADRSTEVVPLIRQYARVVDDTVNQSAGETGGVRHVYWQTTADCLLDVAVVVGTAGSDDSFDATSAALAAAGLTRTDRKYLVWVDAYAYCGIGNFISDDAAGKRNKNNNGPSYTRIDVGCWGLPESAEAHELLHTLGSVQYSAPHSSGSGHCLDEYDRLCYADGPGVGTYLACDDTHEALLDCNHDDYFSTAPPTGSYLATHWNSADSAFLARSEPGATTTTTGRRK